MADLIGLIVLIPAIALSWIALLTILPYLTPQRTARAKRTIATTPGRAFIFGLANLIFFGLLAALLAQGGQFLGLIAMLVLFALITFALSGLAGFVLLIRERIDPTLEQGARMVLGGNVKAAALLVLSLLAPIGGWFVLLPIALIVALGAGVMAQLRKSDTPKPLS